MSSARQTKRQRTRSDQRIRLKVLKPRNPLIAAAAQRIAGSHRKSSKSQRQTLARNLLQDLKNIH